MSVHAMAWVFSHSPAEGSARMVLLALADHAGIDNNDCYPSIRRLMTWTRLTDRGVQKALAELRESGQITIDYGEGRRGTNLYTILMTPEQSSPPNTVHPPEQDSPPPRTEFTTPPEPRSPEPSVEPSLELPTGHLPAKSPSVGGAKNRARRLDREWQPDPADHRKQKFTDQQAADELEKFRDYWCSRGRDAARLDWQATWRNWLRNTDRRRAGTNGHKPSTTTQRVSQGLEVAAAFDRGDIPTRRELA